MKEILATTIAFMKMSVRNRQAIFWNLAFPAIFILLFGVIFNSGNSVNFDVGIVGPSSPSHDAFVKALDASSAFKVHTNQTEQKELKSLKDGDRSVVIVFGEAQGNQKPPITIYYDEGNGPNAQIAVSSVRQILLETSGAANELAIQQKPVNTLDITFIEFLVPGILAMSLMNSGIIGLSTSFVAFRERGIFRRIKVTPFPLWQFLLARVLSQLVIALIDALILIVMAKIVFGMTVRGNPLLILFVLILGGLSFLAIGYLIASFSKNVETAASYANLITFPMLFLSGVFFSVDSAPKWIQPVTKVLPLKYLVDALRDPMMLGRGLGAIWIDLLVLAGVFIVCMALSVRYFRWDAANA
jgi:ABC-2 type transport system permease protein